MARYGARSAAVWVSLLRILALKSLVMLRFQGGATWLSKQEACQKYIQKHQYNEDKLIELAELMRVDVGADIPPEEVQLRFEAPVCIDGCHRT